MLSAVFRPAGFRLLTAGLVLFTTAALTPCFGQHAENAGADSASGSPSATTPAEDSHDAHAVDTNQPPGWQTDLALWSLITFVAFLYVLRKFAWTPLIAGLDKREEGIRRAIAEADEGRRKAQALLADYEAKLRGAEQTVAGMVVEAKRDAERTSSDIIAKAQSDIDAMRQRARDDIAQARNAALADVFRTVNQQVAIAVERVLGRALTEDDQERLIHEALEEVGRL